MTKGAEPVYLKFSAGVFQLRAFDVFQKYNVVIDVSIAVPFALWLQSGCVDNVSCKVYMPPTKPRQVLFSSVIRHARLP